MDSFDFIYLFHPRFLVLPSSSSNIIRFSASSGFSDRILIWSNEIREKAKEHTPELQNCRRMLSKKNVHTKNNRVICAWSGIECMKFHWRFLAYTLDSSHAWSSINVFNFFFFSNDGCLLISSITVSYYWGTKGNDDPQFSRSSRRKNPHPSQLNIAIDFLNGKIIWWKRYLHFIY